MKYFHFNVYYTAELGVFDLGFKGKVVKRGVSAARRAVSSPAGRRVIAGGVAGAAGAGALSMAGGGGEGIPKGTAGLYRVTSSGQIVKVSMPRRRRRGYRMPRLVAEQIRASNDLMKSVSMAVVAGAVTHK